MQAVIGIIVRRSRSRNANNPRSNVNANNGGRGVIRYHLR